MSFSHDERLWICFLYFLAFDGWIQIHSTATVSGWNILVRDYSLSVLSRVSLAMRCENFHTCFLPDTEIKMMKNSKRKKRPRGPWKVDISHDSRETREKFFDTRCCFLLHLVLHGIIHGQSPCCVSSTWEKGWNMTRGEKGEGRITWKCIQCLQTFFPSSFLGPIRVLFLSYSGRKSVVLLLLPWLSSSIIRKSVVNLFFSRCKKTRLLLVRKEWYIRAKQEQELLLSLVVDVIWESAFDDDEDVFNFLTPAAGGFRIRYFFRIPLVIDVLAR